MQFSQHELEIPPLNRFGAGSGNHHVRRAVTGHPPAGARGVKGSLDVWAKFLTGIGELAFCRRVDSDHLAEQNVRPAAL